MSMLGKSAQYYIILHVPRAHRSTLLMMKGLTAMFTAVGLAGGGC